MEDFKQNGKLDFSDAQKKQLKLDFSSSSIDDKQTLTTINSFHQSSGYILDPHTAIGVAVGQKLRDTKYPLVCLATAHPAKFGDVVKEATGLDTELPADLLKLVSSEKKYITIPSDKKQVKEYLVKNAI